MGCELKRNSPLGEVKMTQHATSDSSRFHLSESLRQLCPGMPEVFSGDRFLYDIQAGRPYRSAGVEEAQGVRSEALLHIVPKADAPLIIFCRAIRKEWTIYSDHWRGLFNGQAHVLMLEDFSRRFYTAGVHSLGVDFGANIVWIRKLAKALGANSILTCGSSAGGTGALMYGSALKARKMLALSPITSFNAAFYEGDPLVSPDSQRIKTRLLRLPKVLPKSNLFDARSALSEAGSSAQVHIHYPSAMHWDTKWALHLQGIKGVSLFAHGSATKHNLLDEQAKDTFLDAEIRDFLMALEGDLTKNVTERDTALA